MKNYANLQIQKMSPYHPPLDDRRDYQGLLFDFNERTVPVSQKVVAALQGFISQGKIQVYPEYYDLCQQIASYSKVLPEQIMITNGSDQGIDLIFRTFTQAKDKVIIPSPGFAMFYQSAEIMGNELVLPAYNEDLAFPLEEVLAEIDETTKLVVICNPNNPTGTLLEIDKIEQILQKAQAFGAIVFVDEAYYEFSKLTATSLLGKYPNLIITRTFSKGFGLPSLRIGYVIANAELLEEMLKVRGPYDINMPAYLGASAALSDLEDLNQYVNEVMNEAKPMVEKFFRENQIQFFPSAANYILFKPNTAKDVCALLSQNGVLVRPRSGINIEGTIRLSIGTSKQMQEFIEIYKKFIF